MEVSVAKRLKALEAENAKLKKLLAEHMLDLATLKEMLKASCTHSGLFPPLSYCIPTFICLTS